LDHPIAPRADWGKLAILIIDGERLDRRQLVRPAFKKELREKIIHPPAEIAGIGRVGIVTDNHLVGIESLVHLSRRNVKIAKTLLSFDCVGIAAPGEIELLKRRNRLCRTDLLLHHRDIYLLKARLLVDRTMAEADRRIEFLR